MGGSRGGRDAGEQQSHCSMSSGLGWVAMILVPLPADPGSLCPGSRAAVTAWSHSVCSGADAPRCTAAVGAAQVCGGAANPRRLCLLVA